MAYKDSLVSWWELNEESGERADAHGSNDLTDNNTVLYAAGKQGNAGDFEEVNVEYLSHADNASLSTGNIDFTFGCWVKMESDPGSHMYIISKYATVGNGEYALNFNTTTNRFEFFICDGSALGTVTANQLGAPATGTWYYVIVWHDATNSLVGVQVNNGTADTAAAGRNPQDGSDVFRIGNYGGASAISWDGLIDEVGFWKRLLTASEKTWLYNAGDGRAYSELDTFTPTATTIF